MRGPSGLGKSTEELFVCDVSVSCPFSIGLPGWGVTRTFPFIEIFPGPRRPRRLFEHIESQPRRASDEGYLRNLSPPPFATLRVRSCTPSEMVSLQGWHTEV